jgi:hypothetical protein
MKGSILSGIIGAIIGAIILLLSSVWLKPFNYQSVYILNPKNAIAQDSLNVTNNQIYKVVFSIKTDSVLKNMGLPIDSLCSYATIQIAKVDSIKDNLTCNQISVLKNLENKGLLLTPQEYTSHIADYYNTLVELLIGLFVLFSFVSFFSIKNNAKKDFEEERTKLKDDFEKAKETIKQGLIDDLKDSKSFNDSIINDIMGRVEDGFLSYTEPLSKKVDALDKDIKFIYELESVNEKLDEKSSKSEIIKE